MMYECKRCGYHTQLIFNFTRHEKRVTPCKLKNNTLHTILSSFESKRVEGKNYNLEGKNYNLEGKNYNLG